MSNAKLVDFKRVKGAVTMEQVLQHYGFIERLTRRGDSLSGCCPIHKGTNPTQFRVSISKSIFNCFGDCKQGGNVIDFVSRIEGISIREAAMRLQEWFRIGADLPSNKGESQRHLSTGKGRSQSSATAAKTEDGLPNKPLGFELKNLDPNHPYLAARGLTKETIAEFGLGYCEKGVMAGRIAIRIDNADGKLVAYAGRWPGDPPEGTPKYKLPPGFRKAQEIFNLHRAIRERSERPMIIVEGFFDAIKLWQHGIRRVVALMGSSLSPAQEQLFRKHITARDFVVVMLDEDEAGRAGRSAIADRLAKFAFVKVYTFDAEGLQPEDLSSEALQKLTT